jgi:hypothetical protein
MASHNYYVNEYKGFLWSGRLVVDVACVCVCLSLCVCIHVGPRKQEVNKSMYNTVHSEKIQEVQ